MQDIVFSVSANLPCGFLGQAPVLLRGIASNLRMRVYAGCDMSHPYPSEKLEDVASWTFVMDNDFRADTPYKVVADNESIDLDTTGGNTEIVIPISDMNTPELIDAIGENEHVFLDGELVGYDSSKNAVFALQISGFEVRNRLMSVGEDKTAISGYDILAMENADVEFQYSVSGDGSWHELRTETDCFLRLRVKTTETWSGAIKIAKEATMPNKIDVWGHSELERDYMVMPAIPYETDTVTGETGVTYTRYLDRDTTVVHRTTITEDGEGRQSIVNEVAYGAWDNRQNLEYESPENYPKAV